MSEYFTFGGISSNDFSVLLLADDMTGTQYEYTTVSVAGRTGDLHRGNRRYKNKNRELVIFAGSSAESRIESLNAALLAVTDYARLQSTIHPDWYTLGQYNGDIKPKKGVGYSVGRVALSFDCKPQKYLVTGDTAISVADEGTITNPTLYPSKPLLYVTGVGTLSIGRYTIDVLESVTDMVIDCEMESAYSSTDGTSYNSKIRAYENEFMQIDSGEQTIGLASGMTMSIVPRWWTL